MQSGLLALLLLALQAQGGRIISSNPALTAGHPGTEEEDEAKKEGGHGNEEEDKRQENVQETIAYLPEKISESGGWAWALGTGPQWAHTHMDPRWGLGKDHVVLRNKGTNVWNVLTYAQTADWSPPVDYTVSGLAYRKTKSDEDDARMDKKTGWGKYIVGVDEGEGWVRTMAIDVDEEVKKPNCVWDKSTLCTWVMDANQYSGVLSDSEAKVQEQVCMTEFFPHKNTEFARHSCPAEIYLATTGCEWTAEWNCPDQPTPGSKGEAKRSWAFWTNLGYDLCCTKGGWVELKKQADSKIARKGSVDREKKLLEAERADAWSRIRQVVPENDSQTIAYLPKVVDDKQVLGNYGTNIWMAVEYNYGNNVPGRFKGVTYRKTKDIEDRMDESLAPYRAAICVDEGDGWVKCIV